MLLLLYAIIPCLHTCIVIHLCGSMNSELQTIYVYGHIKISCSLYTTWVIAILFLKFLALPSLHPLTF